MEQVVNGAYLDSKYIYAVALIEIVPCPCSFLCHDHIHVIAIIYSTTLSHCLKQKATLYVGPNPWIIYINPECSGYSFDVKSIFFLLSGEFHMWYHRHT